MGISIHTRLLNGFANYSDTTTGGSPIALTGGVWTALTNDQAGAVTNEDFLPTGVASMMQSNKIDVSDLELGDVILLRPDFTVTPGTNNQLMSLRYTLGTGGNAYTLPLPGSRLDQGGSQPYRFAMDSKLVYMGDANTRDNLIGLEIMTSGSGTVVNSGIAIAVIKRG